jgi:preprotein translocase subunit SecD
MRFLKILVLTTSLALFPIIGFSKNTTDSSPNFSVLQVVQDQLILDKTTVKSASLIEKKDGIFGGLQIEINPAASNNFIHLTKTGMGKTMNLVLNNKIIFSAKIRSTLQTQFMITGITREEAQSIMSSLRK